LTPIASARIFRPRIARVLSREHALVIGSATRLARAPGMIAATIASPLAWLPVSARA